MKFSTQEEIDAPIDAVWAAVTDAADYEAQARRRGIEVRRNSAAGELGVGTTWVSRFNFHGLQRELKTSISTLDAPRLLVLASHVGGLDAVARVELESLDPDRTNLTASVELKPTGVPGRLLLQTLRVMRKSLNTKFKGRVWRFARAMETA